MSLPADTKAAISHAVSYIKGESGDALIARFYGVTIKEVAAIRRSRPIPRPMMQHEPIEDRSIHGDEARAEDQRRRCESHNVQLWTYYTNAGANLGLTREEYCVLVNSNAGVTNSNVALLKKARRSLPIG